MNSKLILILFGLIIHFPNIIYGQTKQETIDWIEVKLKKLESIDNENYTSFKVNLDCSFIIINYHKSGNGYKQIWDKKGNLKDLNPASVRYSTFGIKKFIVDCTNDKECLKEKSTFIDSNGKIYSQHLDYINKSNHVYIQFPPNYEDLQYRFQKALVHLIRLCGGKEEPF